MLSRGHIDSSPALPILRIDITLCQGALRPQIDLKYSMGCGRRATLERLLFIGIFQNGRHDGHHCGKQTSA